MVKISHISITHFRSIESANVNIGNINSLVGVNSSGKSAILKAFNCFFNLDKEENNFKIGTHNYNTRKKPTIEINFVELSTSWTTQDSTRVKLTYTGSGFRHSYYDDTDRKYKPLSRSNFNEIFDHIKFIFIPTHRDHTVANQGIDGLLHEAVISWLDQKKRDNWSKSLSREGDKFLESALSGLQDKLTTIALLPSSEKYIIGFNKSIDYSILLPHLELKVEESGVTNLLSETGSGSQSIAVLALYSFIAESSNISYILGFEEPEQNLHPQAQQQLATSLKSMNLQVIFTTHSPVIVDTLDHREIILCKKIPDNSRGFKTNIHQIDQNFFNTNRINEKSYIRFHRRRNSDFFFSKYLLVVESPNDAETLEALLEINGLNPNQNGGKIISADSKENFRFMYPLTKELGIPALYISDKDFFLKEKKVPITERNNLTGEEITKEVNMKDQKGFPVYKDELQSNSLVHSLFRTQEEKEYAVECLINNHTRALDLLEGKKFLSMKYAFEHELLGSGKGLELAFRVLNIQNPSERKVRFILENRSNVIKKSETLIKILRNMDPKNYPRTLSRIIKICKELERETNV